MIVLVDTTVWVDHLRNDRKDLRQMLDDGRVLCHPFVIGELGCVNLRNRDEILSLLKALPNVALAQHDEVLLLALGAASFRKRTWLDRLALACLGAD